MIRRHPILASLAALFLLGAAALAVFVATFDLDRYRTQLQKSLSQALGTSVQLGRATLTLRHGPALEFAELRIGDPQSPTGFIQAEKLYLKPELRPLLEGRLTLSRILLETPEIRFAMPAAGVRPAPKNDRPAPAPLWNAALVRTLEVDNGQLFLLLPQGTEDAAVLKIQRLTGSLRNIGPSARGQVELAGELVQQTGVASFTLVGQGELPATADAWRQAPIDLRLEADGLAPAELLASFGMTGGATAVSGQTDLRLQAEGNPGDGLDIEVRLAGRDLALRNPRQFRQPVPLNQFSMRATWFSSDQDERLEDLAAELDGIWLKGAAAAHLQESGWHLEGNLEGGSALDQLCRLLPDAEPQSPTALAKKQLSGGSLGIKGLRFAGNPETLSDPARLFGLQQAELSLEGVLWKTAKAGPVEQLALQARLSDEVLSIEQGRGRLWGQEFRFAGEVKSPHQPEPQLALKLSGTLPAARLLEMLGEPKSLKLQAAGPLPVHFELTGTPRELTLDGSADLSQLAVAGGEAFDKPAGLASDLFFTARLTPERVELSHGRLNLPPIDIRIRGTQERGNQQEFQLTVDLDRLDMKKAVDRSPVLAKLSPTGTIGASCQLTGSGGKLQSYRGTLYLRDLGLHLTRAIADLNQVNGQIHFEENRAVIDHLSAKLGTSPLKISGHLEDFADPHIDLRVRAAAIRADDLIFRSDADYLRDVDGHLVIDREALRFDPVRVRLDGGTQAVVTGSVSNFKAPLTRLDIRAEYGNIDEVIGLWKGPENPAPPPGRGGEAGLYIKAYARQGHLGGLKFQDADGEITLRDGVLVIYPLHFRAEQGYCVGHVAVARQDSGPPLLKMSGHIENFRAGAIYSDLLHREGLITGKLRGDFYLEGLAGTEFLPSSSGGFHLEISNGVLRKFRGLARVFSLLNVSQILTLQLPDMASEGMPFNRLSTGIALNKGVLSTEDLFIDSNAMNMSLVGSLDLNKEKLDTMLGVKPLRTVDKIVTGIPVAGWLLTGEEKALLTAHFHIRGDSGNPEVIPMPINTVSEKVLGIFKRVLGLPGKVITDLGGMGEGKSAE